MSTELQVAVLLNPPIMAGFISFNQTIAGILETLQY